MPMDELLSRAMPHSPEAEQAVLGSMLIDADCIKDVMDKLQPQDFYLQQNREIFETIYSMFIYSRPIDGVTVAREMEKNGVYRDDTRAYLLQLMEVTPTSANVMEYAGIIRDKALLRSMAKAAGDIAAMVQEGVGTAGDLLSAAEQKIYAIRQGRGSQEMATVGAVHGQDQYGPECGPVGGQGLRQNGGYLLPGNVQGAAGDKAFGQRGAY